MTAIMYQNAFFYNLIMRFLHGNYNDYKTIASMVEGQSILDLGCASSIVHGFLPENVKYEGWELNDSFVAHDRKRGLAVQKKNVFEIKNEGRKWDTIIIKDLLHHVHPKEKELLEMLKGKTNYVIVCEPILDKKRFKDIVFGHKLFNFVHHLFGDADSFNHFNSGRLFQEKYDKSSFLSMLNNFGNIVEQKQSKEMLVVKIGFA